MFGFCFGLVSRSRFSRMSSASVSAALSAGPFCFAWLVRMSSPAVLLCPVLLVVGLVVGVFVSLAFCARVVCFSLVWGSLFLLRCGLYVSLQEGMAFWIGKRW